MGSDNYSEQEIYLVSFIENLMNEGIFAAEDFFAFQMMAANFIFTIRTTKERRLKDKQNEESPQEEE